MNIDLDGIEWEEEGRPMEMPPGYDRWKTTPPEPGPHSTIDFTYEVTLHVLVEDAPEPEELAEALSSIDDVVEVKVRRT